MQSEHSHLQLSNINSYYIAVLPTLQRCDNKECLAALESGPYLKMGQVGKVGKVRKLCHIFEIFCTYSN